MYGIHLAHKGFCNFVFSRHFLFARKPFTMPHEEVELANSELETTALQPRSRLEQVLQVVFRVLGIGSNHDRPRLFLLLQYLWHAEMRWCRLRLLFLRQAISFAPPLWHGSRIHAPPPMVAPPVAALDGISYNSYSSSDESSEISYFCSENRNVLGPHQS